MFKDLEYFFKSRRPMIFLFDVCFLVLPGIATLFIWNNDLFLKLDWVKLILLSATMMVPLVFLNMLLFFFFQNINPANDAEIVDSFSMAVITTGVLVFVVLGIAYFRHSSFFEFLVTLGIAEIAAIGSIWFDTRKARRKK